MFLKNRMKNVISVIKETQKAMRGNIESEYAAGYYNGIEFVLSMLEGSEPEYLFYEEKDEGKTGKEVVKRTKNSGKITKRG